MISSLSQTALMKRKTRKSFYSTCSAILFLLLHVYFMSVESFLNTRTNVFVRRDTRIRNIIHLGAAIDLRAKIDSKEEGTVMEHKLNAMVTRRRLLQFSTAAAIASSSILGNPYHANAELVQFPCNYKLMNTYHIMRAGESILESQDILSTNPLFLTNREDALSSKGREQVEATCNDMERRDVNPSVIKYAISAKCVDTVDIISTQLQVCTPNPNALSLS